MVKIYKALFVILTGIVFAFTPQSSQAQLNISASVTQDVSCFDGGDGEITLNINSGTAPFTVEFFLFNGSEIPVANITGTTETNIVLNDNISTSDGTVTYFNNFQTFGIRANNNPTLVGSLGATTYRVRVTSSDASFNTAGSGPLTISEPPELIASVNSIIDDCANNGSGEILLDVSGGTSPYSFAWSGPTAGIGDTDNPINLNAGTYDVVVTDDNGCTTNINGIIVDAGPNAGVYVGTAGEACTSDSAFDLFTLLDGSQDAGGSWTITSGAGASIADPLVGAVDFTSATAGAFTFEYTVTGSGSCVDDIESVTVNLTQAANAGVYVGTAGEACTSDSAFDLFALLDGSQDAGGSWSITSGTGASIADPLVGEVDFSSATAGVFTFEYTVTGSAPCLDDVEEVTVNLSDAANAGVYVGTAGEACTSDSAFDLFTLLDGSQDAGGSWTITSGVGASIADPLVGAVDFTSATAGAFTFEYTVTGSGSCVDDIESVTVNLTQAANAGVYVGTAGEACTSDSAFDLFALLDGSQDAGGSWTITSGVGASIADPLVGEVDFSSATAGVFTFEYTVTGSAPCLDDVEEVTVNLSDAANAGVYVGTAGEACTSDSAFDLFTLLDGSQDAGGSWTITSGVGASIADPLVGAVDFTSATAGAFTFEYTVTGSGSCVDDVEEVTVNLTNAANAGVYVGTAGEACTSDSAFDLFALLDGSQDAGGSWTITSGVGASIADPLVGEVDFSSATAGVFTFEYTVTGSAPCLDDVEEVTVNLSDAANAGVYVGTAGEACTSDSAFDLFTLLDGSQDAGGSWTITSGVGASIADPLVGAVDFTSATAGAFTFEYTVTGSGSCVDDIESVTVNLTQAANAGVYVGTAGEACTSDSAFDLFALLDGSQDAGGSWSITSGTGASIADPLVGEVDFSSATAGVFTFEYTVTGSAPCLDDVEEVTVNLSDAANAGVYVGTAGEACTSDSAFDLFTLLDGSQDAGGSWTITSGVGASIADPLVGAVDFTSATAGAFTFEYTVTGSGSCVDDIESVTVNLTQAANAGVYVGTAGEACTSDSAFDLFALLDGSQDAGGSWTITSGVGASIADPLVGEVDFSSATAGVFTFEYTVTGSAPCLDDVEEVTVNLSDAANAGVYVGTAGEACTSDSAFDLFTLLDGSQDAGGSWTITSGVGASIADPLVGAVDFTSATAGAFTFEYTVTGSGSCVDDVEEVTVNLTNAANAGVYVGTAGEACTSDSAFDLFALLDGSQDAGGSWTITSGVGASIADPLVGEVDFSSATAGVFTFEYTVTGSAPCLDDVEEVTVNLSDAANAGVYVGTAGEACTSDSAFDLFTLLDGSQDAGGSWTITSGVGASIADPLVGAVDFTSATAGAFTFEYTVTGSGSCVDDVEEVTVNLTNAANAGVYVGTAGEACTSDSAFDLFTLLDGSQDAGGSWTITSGTGASIADPLVGEVDFSSATAGVFTFEYTVTGSAPCLDDVEEVTVNLSDAANAGVYVGTAGEACTSDSAFDLFTLLDGSQDAGGSWTITSGAGASIADPLVGAVDFTSATAGAFTFEYTVTGSGSCVDDIESVTVNLTQAANAGVYVGTAGEACTSDSAFDLFALLDGSQDAGGSWSITSGTGASIADPLVGEVDFSSATAGVFTFEYTVTGSAPCLDDVEEVTVNLSDAANAGVYVGTAGEACTSDSAFDLFTLLDGSQDAGGSWTITSGVGASIADPLVGAVDFTSATAGAFTFEYTVTGSGSCVDDIESVTVNLTQAANAGVYVGTAGEACTSDSAFDLFALLDGSQDAGGSWTITSGVGASIADPLVGEVDFSSATAGVFTFEYTVTGSAPCLDDVEEVTVNLSDAANAGVYVGTAGEACTSDSAFDLFTLLDGSQDAGGSWTITSGVGASIADPLVGAVDFTSATAGAFTFEYTVTGSGSCIDATETVTVNVSGLDVTENITNTTGCGVPDGEISLTINSSFTGDSFTIDWVGPNGFSSNDQNITGLEGGDYTVTVNSDNTVCSFTETYTVIDPVPFNIIATPTDQSQCGTNNGEVAVSVFSGTGPFNYYVVNTATLVEVSGSRSDADASTTYSFDQLAPGDYEVFVEEGLCTQSESFTIDPVSEIVATVDSETPADCGGGANGTITLSITDVGNDFDIFVDGVSEGIQAAGTASYTITGLALGTYDIIVRDVITNCEETITEDVNENATYTIDAENINNITTCGGSDGEIELVVSGGSPSFTWTGPTGFTDPGDVNIITGLSIPGTYQVTLDEAGCQVIRNYNITAPTPPTADAGADSTICESTLILYANTPDAAENGVWSVISAPGAAVVAFNDATVASTEVSGLTELGDYILEWAVDNPGTSCSNTDQIVITKTSITTADAGIAQQVCGNSATLAANAVGATETGTWSVISGSGTFAAGEENNPAAEVTGLSIGDNILEWTISDDNMICSSTSSQVTITVDPLPTAFAGADQSFCDITALDLSTLASIPLAENGTIEWTTSSSDGSFNDNTLESPIYTFGADDLANTSVTLTMTVTGTAACAAEVVSDEVVLDINSFPSIQPIADASICFNEVNSTFNVDAVVSNEASILWSSSGSGTFDDETSASTFYTPSSADSIAGSVDLTITAEGLGACGDNVLTFSLDINSIRIENPVITETTACGSSDGAINIDVASSESADTFEFLWTDNDGNLVSNSDEDLSNLQAGTYNVQVTSDLSGCTATASFVVNDPVPFTLSLGTPTDQSSCGINNGEITASVSGNSDNLTYYILDVNGDEVSDSRVDDTSDVNYSFTDLAPGNYTLVVEENTCAANETFTINPAPAITASIDPTNVTAADCNGGTNGSIIIDVTDVGNDFEVIVDGGTPSLETAGTSTVTLNDLTQGNYSILIRDVVTSCEVVLNQIINEDATFTIDNESVTDIVNCGAAEGAIAIDISGLTGPTTYSWTGPQGSGFTASSQDINGLSIAGDYTLSIEDDGCIVERIYTVSQPAECDYDCEDFRVSPITEAATCLGVDDGKLFFLLSNVNPSSPELNFDIKPAGTDDSLYNRFTVANIGQGLIVEIDSLLGTGTYTIVASDPNLSCITDTININIGTKSTLTASVDIEQPTCTVSSGSISANISGTTDSFEYILFLEGDSISANMTGNFTDLVEGNYELAFVNQNTNACGIENQTFTIENTAVVDQSAVDINITNPECGETFGTISASLNNLPSNYEFILVDENSDEIARNSTGIFNDVPEGTYVIQFENIVDPAACPIADRGGIVIENNGSFSAVASEVENIVCFGDNTGSAIITLEGISTGFYSLDNGQLWTEFTSGNRIIGLPAVNNLLISDQPGTSDCELSVEVGIEYLSQPIALEGSIELIVQASCTVSEQIGEISVPAVTGGVAPYTYAIDGNVVELDAERNIGGLARNVNQLIITDDTGCSESFDIRSIVSPNEVRAVITEINPNNNCIDDPEGIQVTIDQETIDNVPGPYNLILNRVNETVTSEYVLDINTNGSNVFSISQFNVDEGVPFIKGARYRWTVRAVDNDQACSADNFVTINGGAIIPTFDIEASDVACFQESGAITLSNINADETIPLLIEVYEGNDVDPTQTFTLNSIPESGRFLIDQSIYGMISRGDYIVKLLQQPDNCNSAIESENASVFIDAPVAQLNVELVPEPNLPPGIDRGREDMNPMPTTRPDRANGSISIRLVEPISGANGYSAQIFLLTPLGGNNSSDYTLPSEAIEFDADRTITFDNLLPGIYEIEYYDSFGCGLDGNRLVFDGEGSSDITVDFDRSPFIPNVFTPNNDGKNDQFRILNLPDNGAELIVTNRTGAIVYRDSNYRASNLWDGGDNPDGIYFYQLTVDGSVQSGWVEIIRGKR